MKIELLNEAILKENKEVLQEYIKELFKISGLKYNDERIKEIYNNMIKYTCDNSAKIIGALENEKILGFIWAYKVENNNESMYHINYFIVDSKERRKNIGRKLMEKVYEIARNDGIKRVELLVSKENKEALKFYQKQEFEIERYKLCKKI